jgi:hypothetical protein
MHFEKDWIKTNDNLINYRVAVDGITNFSYPEFA